MTLFDRREAQEQVRPSAIAGTWYPASQQALAAKIDQFLADVPSQELAGEPVALVVPHAGYAYSGQVAAYAYRHLEDRSYERVVVLSPSHRPLGGAFLVTRMAYYATPLGRVEVDHDVVDRLGERIPITRVRYDEEHSLEIQLPFLQRTLGEFLLVPVMMGSQSWSDCQALAEALDAVLGPERPLVVASSDLCHAHDYDQVQRTDEATLSALQEGEAHSFWRTARRLQGACGYGPIATALLLGQRWGAEGVQLLQATNSADVTGRRGGYVVGYAAAVVVS